MDEARPPRLRVGLAAKLAIGFTMIGVFATAYFVVA